MKSLKSHLEAKAALPIRRILSAALGLLIGGAATLVTSQAAFAERSFSGVRVDTSALGASSTARDLKSSLESRLQYYFANELHGDRNAPMLVVRLTAVTIQSAPPQSSGFGGNGGETNYLDGEALVVGRGGVILQRRPLLTALNGDQGGWYLPDFEKRKAASLANSYAYWLKRQLPDQ